MKQIVGLVLILCCTQMVAQEVFPDGKAIPEKCRFAYRVSVYDSPELFGTVGLGRY